MTSQWERLRLNSPASRLFTQQFIRAQIKEKSSAPLAFVRGIHPVTGELPAQMPSNAENAAIWWCHHDNREACGKVDWYQTKIKTQNANNGMF